MLGIFVCATLIRMSFISSKPELRILDGRIVRDSLIPVLSDRVKSLAARTPTCIPMLAIIQVGNRPDSTAFIKVKRSFAKKIGVNERHIQLPEISSQHQIVETIQKCNEDREVTGIIVQLPLPEGIDRDVVIDAIDPRKDVDGLTAHNSKLWFEGNSAAVWPATARGIRELLKYYGISLAGKEVAVIGRSMLVGKPIAAMCLAANATVTVCHSKTPDLVAETLKADVIISATGKIGLITAQHVKPGAVVIDVGISRTEEGTLTGDVDFDSVKDKVAAISPVPGGVGPMTVCALFENLLDLAEAKK